MHTHTHTYAQTHYTNTHTQDTAIEIKKWLEAGGISCWICTENLTAGANYRNDIVNAVDNCTVFLPLINSEWAKSGECESEFNYAKRLHLTSHEQGRTQRNSFRKPALVPIAFPDLDWGAHKHIKLLASEVLFFCYS